MTRENMIVEGNDVVVKLQDKVIHNVTAVRAHGSDDYPNRKLRYAADELGMEFDDDGLAQKINGSGNATLVSTTDASETTVTADRVNLDLQPDGNESVLTQVAATGNGVVTSKPLAAPGRQLSETHVLRSETLEMKMRPGGREIESVVTKAPGTLEFLPNLPSQHHRTLDGKDFVIAYGPQNRLDSFRAAGVKTHTDPTAEERRRNRPQSVTTSRDLEARFDPKTNHLQNMQQSGDFTYEEGDRKARAAKATMDADQNVILLDTGARIWDATGIDRGRSHPPGPADRRFRRRGQCHLQPSARQGPEEELRNALRRRPPAGHRPQDGLAQSQSPDSLRRRGPHVAGRQPHTCRRRGRGPRSGSPEAHPRGRRPRGHQSVGRA